MDTAVPVTVNTGHEMMSDLSEPSSPESEMYDAAELLGGVSDDVTNQLAAAGIFEQNYFDLSFDMACLYI